MKKRINELHIGDTFAFNGYPNDTYLMSKTSSGEAVALTDSVRSVRGEMCGFPGNEEVYVLAFGKESLLIQAEERKLKEIEGKKKTLVHNKAAIVKNYAERRMSIAKELILFAQRFTERDPNDLVYAYSRDLPCKPVHPLLKSAMNTLSKEFQRLRVLRDKLDGKDIEPDT